MDYEIVRAEAYPDHSVVVEWSDGAVGSVDLTPFLARGGVFAALQDPAYFVANMSLMDRGIGLSWPDEVDFSSDGLRADARLNRIMQRKPRGAGKLRAA